MECAVNELCESWEKSKDLFIEFVFVSVNEILFTELAFDIGDIEEEDEEDMNMWEFIVESTSIVVFAVVASVALDMLISDMDIFDGRGSSLNFVVLDVLSLAWDSIDTRPAEKLFMYLEINFFRFCFRLLSLQFWTKWR